jgi:hypothetical protein
VDQTAGLLDQVTSGSMECIADLPRVNALALPSLVCSYFSFFPVMKYWMQSVLPIFLIAWRFRALPQAWSTGTLAKRLLLPFWVGLLITLIWTQSTCRFTRRVWGFALQLLYNRAQPAEYCSGGIRIKSIDWTAVNFAVLIRKGTLDQHLVL